jgi:hypothetical protein
VLRQAGVIRQWDDGTRRWTQLREGDLEARFPGLLTAVTAVPGEVCDRTASQVP